MDWIGKMDLSELSILPTPPPPREQSCFRPRGSRFYAPLRGATLNPGKGAVRRYPLSVCARGFTQQGYPGEASRGESSESGQAGNTANAPANFSRREVQGFTPLQPAYRRFTPTLFPGRNHEALSSLFQEVYTSPTTSLHPFNIVFFDDNKKRGECSRKEKSSNYNKNSDIEKVK